MFPPASQERETDIREEGEPHSISLEKRVSGNSGLFLVIEIILRELFQERKIDPVREERVNLMLTRC